jgi:hypothetical protein
MIGTKSFGTSGKSNHNDSNSSHFGGLYRPFKNQKYCQCHKSILMVILRHTWTDLMQYYTVASYAINTIIHIYIIAMLHTIYAFSLATCTGCHEYFIGVLCVFCVVFELRMCGVITSLSLSLDYIFCSFFFSIFLIHHHVIESNV